MNIETVFTAVGMVVAGVTGVAAAYYKFRATAQTFFEKVLTDAGLSLSSLAAMERGSATIARMKKETSIVVVSDNEETAISVVLLSAHFRRVKVLRSNHADILQGDVIVFDGWKPAYEPLARAMGCGAVYSRPLPSVVVYTVGRVDLGPIAHHIVCANSHITLAVAVQNAALLQVK